MTETTKRRSAVTRAEFDHLATEVAETRKMVEELHHALMQPQPPHKSSLLDRMATTTVYLESGKRAGAIIVWCAGVLAALGAAAAALRYGQQ